MTVKNIGASVRARINNKAKADNVNTQFLLTRYALERMLYRLAVSEHRDSFLLKGALLFDLWYDVPLRPTRDIDLLGFGMAEIPHLIKVFEDLCAIQVEDGINFESASITAEEIRKDANYSGTRVTVVGKIDGAKCTVQVDVGYGDAVTPAPEMATYPVMLEGMPAPELRVYPQYTVIAEKFEAIVSLGMANSRMKDYFDLWVLLRNADLDQRILEQAVRATLARRVTLVPAGVPSGLTEQFSSDIAKLSLWNAFVTRNKLDADSLESTVRFLRDRFAFIYVKREVVQEMDIDYLRTEPTLPEELRVFREKLREHSFSENVAWILNTPVLIPENSFTDTKGVEPELTKKLKINLIEDQRNIKYSGGQRIKLVVCDKKSGTFNDAPDYAKFNVVYVIHNGKCVMDVLMDYSMKGERREYSVKHICELTVHRFEDGPWVSDLLKLTNFLKKQRYKNA